MRLPAFSLMETLVALSILAFVFAASIFLVGDLHARAQFNLGKVYMTVKNLEHAPVSAPSVVDMGAYEVIRSIVPYNAEIDVVTVTAVHRNGRILISIRKLAPHEKVE